MSILLQETEEEIKDFVRYCGIAPAQNYLVAIKSASAKERSVGRFLGSDDMTIRLYCEKPHILIFTHKEVIVKKKALALSPRNYEYHLLRLPLPEIKYFQAFYSGNQNYITFTYRNEAQEYYFYQSLSQRSAYVNQNFQYLQLKRFYGLLPDKWKLREH